MVSDLNIFQVILPSSIHASTSSAKLTRSCSCLYWKCFVLPYPHLPKSRLSSKTQIPHPSEAFLVSIDELQILRALYPSDLTDVIFLPFCNRRACFSSSLLYKQEAKLLLNKRLFFFFFFKSFHSGCPTTSELVR